jgi:hypothetical protein
MAAQTYPLAESLFHSAFHPAREPRSDAYRRGVLDGLRYHTGEGPSPQHVVPYPPGTAEADAWYAGIGESHLRWRTYIDQEDQSTKKQIVALKDLHLRRCKPGQWLADPDHRGLRFRMGDGGVGTWWYRYRSLDRVGGDGRPMLEAVRIGDYSVDGYVPHPTEMVDGKRKNAHVTLEAARAVWRQLKTLRRQKGDPRRYLSQQKVMGEPFTVEKLVGLYMREWAQQRKRSFVNDSRVLSKDLLPRYGDMPVSQFGPADARELVETVALRGNETATQLLSIARKM